MDRVSVLSNHFSSILHEETKSMVVVKLNRPKIFNCLSRSMLTSLRSLLKQAQGRWVLLTGG